MMIRVPQATIEIRHHGAEAAARMMVKDCVGQRAMGKAMVIALARAICQVVRADVLAALGEWLAMMAVDRWSKG